MRLSKLVSTIATSRTLIETIERRIMYRVSSLATTAFSKNDVSMKYRGIWELHSRRKADKADEGNVLQYHSVVREDTPQQMFVEWFAKVKQAPQEQKGRRRARK